MSKVKKINRILIGIFILASVMLAFLTIAGWYYILSMSKTANKVATETKNMEKEAKQLSILDSAYRKVLPKNDLVLDALPVEKNISVFLADFESLAKSDGLNILTSRIGDTKTKSRGNYSQTTSKGNYFELPIQYELTGNFSNFRKFILDTNSLRRINTISDLKISSDGSDKSGDKIKAEFNVSIFLKQEEK